MVGDLRWLVAAAFFFWVVFPFISALERASGPRIATLGLAAHKAWVLAELRRTGEARAALAAVAIPPKVLGEYEAEWHLSRFAIAFAERGWSKLRRASTTPPGSQCEQRRNATSLSAAAGSRSRAENHWSRSSTSSRRPTALTGTRAAPRLPRLGTGVRGARSDGRREGRAAAVPSPKTLGHRPRPRRAHASTRADPDASAPAGRTRSAARGARADRRVRIALHRPRPTPSAR